MNTKKIIVILLALAIVGVLIWKLAPTHEAKAPVETAPVTAVAPTTTLAGATLQPNGDFQYVNEAEFTRVSAVYPSKTSLADTAANAKARLAMENWITQAQSDFLTNDIGVINASEQARIQSDNEKYTFDITYSKYDASTTLSYVYLIEEDTGGAHPNPFYKTFTFDQTGTEINLADLFTPNSSYLDVLSKLSYDNLVKTLPAKLGAPLDNGELDWIKTGTAATSDNLQFFYIDGTDLVLIFPPYQVAPYAAGEIEVGIPLASLSNILKK